MADAAPIQKRDIDSATTTVTDTNTADFSTTTVTSTAPASTMVITSVATTVSTVTPAVSTVYSGTQTKKATTITLSTKTQTKTHYTVHTTIVRTVTRVRTIHVPVPCPAYADPILAPYNYRYRNSDAPAICICLLHQGWRDGLERLLVSLPLLIYFHLVFVLVVDDDGVDFFSLMLTHNRMLAIYCFTKRMISAQVLRLHVVLNGSLSYLDTIILEITCLINHS